MGPFRLKADKSSFWGNSVYPNLGQDSPKCAPTVPKCRAGRTPRICNMLERLFFEIRLKMETNEAITVYFPFYIPPNLTESLGAAYQ